MLNTVLTPSGMIVGLTVGAALIVAACLAIGASLSTSIFVLALFTTPGVVIALLAQSAPSPTVAQILYAVTKDDRS